MKENIIAWCIWVLIPLSAVTATYYHAIRNIDNFSKNTSFSLKHDERIYDLAKFYTKHKCLGWQYAKDYIQAADKYKIDYRVAVAISVLESSCGRHFLFNNLWGLGSAASLRHFSTIPEGIDTITQILAEGSYYKNKTIEQKVRIWRSGTSQVTEENQKYWINFQNLMKEF